MTVAEARVAEEADDPHICAMAPEGRTSGWDAPAGSCRLAIARLSLTRFRSYGEARFEVGVSPVVLTGPNGAGKTNLLEAISFLAPGRGLRRARLSEVDRRTAEENAPGPWAVAATVATPHGTVRIGTGREPTPSGGERRVVRIDGMPARSQTALAEHVNLVWLTPQMDRLFLEGAGARRRFLDRLVLGFDPGHAARAAAYDQALRERGRILRDGPFDAAWLATLEAGMASHGVSVALARRTAAAQLDEACAESASGFLRPRLTAAGTVEAWLAEHSMDKAEAALRDGLAASRRRDAETGGAAIGPHRSDLAVTDAASGRPAEQCSTGEQKALLVAILLAHARLQVALRGAAPIMLLDEVAAHLDRQRRAALFAELVALGAQAWLTGTEPEIFIELRPAAQFLAIRDAMLVAA